MHTIGTFITIEDAQEQEKIFNFFNTHRVKRQKNDRFVASIAIIM